MSEVNNQKDQIEQVEQPEQEEQNVQKEQEVQEEQSVPETVEPMEEVIPKRKDKAQDKNKQKKKKHLLALLLLLLLVAVGTFLFGNIEDISSLPENLFDDRDEGKDGEFTLDDYETLKAKIQGETDENMMNFRMNTNPVLKDGEVNWLFQNMKDNKHIVQVDVVYNGEVIYKSPTLKPNQYVDVDSMEVSGLPSGENKVVALFSVFEQDTLEKIAEHGVNLTLTNLN